MAQYRQQSEAQHITVCQIDSLWLDEVVLKISTLRWWPSVNRRAWHMKLTRSCAWMCACRERVILCTDACACRLGASPEKLSVAAPLRVCTERQPWHFLRAERLRLPCCRRGASSLSAGTDLDQSLHLLFLLTEDNVAAADRTLLVSLLHHIEIF